MRAENREREFRVRNYREEDAAAASEILEESKEAASWSRAALDQTLLLRGVVALVSERNGAASGFIIGRQVADEGEILNLAVRETCRRQGEGRALAKRLLEVFAKAGVVKVFLEVRESNEAAIALYEKLGFGLAGRREKYYREPVEAALILEKR